MMHYDGTESGREKDIKMNSLFRFLWRLVWLLYGWTVHSLGWFEEEGTNEYNDLF